MYNITSSPIAGLNNRTYSVAAGAIVGGGSAVNGMFFDRGSKADYDAWEALGNKGWGWASLLPYFKKSVTFTPPAPDIAVKYNYTWDMESAYGGHGPIQVSFPPWNWPALGLGWEAWKQLGISKQKEGANGNAFDVYQAPSALDPVTRTRSYAKTAHFDPYRNRTNYHLLTGYQVTEIRFVRDLRAVGVNVVKRGTKGPKIAIQARRETIIAAGAIWTPWLLQRSGLGPRTVLEAAGVEVKRDFSGVGANFQDHPVAFPVYNLTNKIFPDGGTPFANESWMEEGRREYEQNRTGPWTVARGNQAAFLPMKTVHPGWQAVIDSLLAQDAKKYLPRTYDKNLTDGFLAQRNVTLDLFKRVDAAVFEYSFAGSPVGGALQRPLSRGTVNINPMDPLGPPVVNYRTFSNPIDVINSIAMFKYGRKYNSQPALQSLGPIELVPGANITADADIEKALRELLVLPSFAHPSGTAAMLPEEYGGVVAPDLRIWGTRRLSVVDASIMPLIPASHLCTTVYAVAEKAADLIKDRTGWDV
jgi:choline dehydrogenase-like flavoprotein